MSIDRLQRQPPLDAPRDRAGLVVREVDRVLVAQQPQDRVDAAIVVSALSARERLPVAGRAERGDRGGDLFGRQHLIDDAGAHRAERHAVELRRVRALAEHDAAGLADLLDAARAVAAAARQHHRDRALADVLRQRSEEQVDRQRQPVARIAVAQQQPPLPDDHLLHRRQQVDRVRLDRHVVLGLADRHRRPPRQQLVHQALEVRRQVLQDDERHAGVGGQLREQPFERLEPAGRRADADDVESPLVLARDSSCAPSARTDDVRAVAVGFLRTVVIGPLRRHQNLSLDSDPAGSARAEYTPERQSVRRSGQFTDQALLAPRRYRSRLDVICKSCKGREGATRKVS